MKTKVISFLTEKIEKKYNITFLQTPRYGDQTGYKAVYRLRMKGKGHREVLETLFRTFNVADLLPSDFSARFMMTGDIIRIEEENRSCYYRLESGGWRKLKQGLTHSF
ncbi:MAG TPA: YodL domain-containing protein [Chondromyces sp.]|nr:YodL domain-containing protein [Chondromyces sp.]